MKRFLCTSLLVGFVSVGAWGQVSVTNGSPSFTIDFTSTMPTTVGSNPQTAYTAAGIEPNPTNGGRLNSNAWAVTGWSDGDLAFGGTQTTVSTDYTRGPTTLAVTTGGFYAYTGVPASATDPVFMIQPSASDFAPGTLTLRIQNNGTSNLTQVYVSYNLWVRNDEARSNSFNFSYSTDDITYTPVGALDFTSGQAADGFGWVLVGTAPSRSTTITGLSIAPGSNFYIRWSCADVAGTGARDEFGLDDINVTATFNSLSTDYFRSIATGNWGNPTTWESSTNNVNWSAATLAPDFNANAITIQNGTVVTIAAAASADQLTILSGGTLNHTNGVSFTLNDGASTDMTINNGGIYVLNGTQPLGTGTVDILSGGTVRVDSDVSPSESDDFASGSSNGLVTFFTGSIYEWATTIQPAWNSRIYFTSGNNTTYRFSQPPSLAVGGGNPTIIYGTLEANAALTMTGAGTKTITYGIIGSSTVDASTAGSGALIINGTTSVLGGGTLTLQSGVPLQLTGSIATMTSSKIITGDITFSGTSKIILGNFDLTVSGSINGYGPTVYVQTDGTGYLTMNAVSGTRVFPVGFSNLNAVYINNGGGNNYSVRVENGINPGVSLPTFGINRTWNIFANVLTSGVQASFWYYTADANAGVIPGTDDMEVLLYSGAAWSITPGNNAITPTGSNPWLVTTVAVTGNLTINTTAVPYIVGKSGGWVLPIDCIISTRAQKRNNTGIISWTVNSCSDVSSFEVQRSVGNGGYQTIGTVVPGVNQTDFNFTDPSLARGTNLYRIKVNRLAGSIKYSNTVALIYDSNELLITSLAPNPVQDVATLTLSTARQGTANFTVYDLSGKLVKQWHSNIAEGNNTIAMNVTGLPAGMYHVLVSTTDARTVTRFVKQ